MIDFEQEALLEAEKSPCKKRKVGAILVSGDKIIGRGHNHLHTDSTNTECEDKHGKTLNAVIHAEMDALNMPYDIPADTVMYVTHTPCDNCRAALEKNCINYKVVESFMKFDSGKLRYSLMPPLALEALASVLTYGAKKYKPNNWKQVDSADRYWDALYRHLEARRAGEVFDKESKLPHLWHALTNITFLVYFEGQNNR